MTIAKSISILNRAGQSIWYDNLSRDVLKSGELQRLIDSGVSGLTSNPTIFKKAIADSTNYDLRIGEMKGAEEEEICETLMIEDVGIAADLLLPIYQRTNGADGYASIEVSPFLARDTKGTVAAAKRIWSKLSRLNVMIKIPATAEGLPAISEVLSAGINVNVTLIFSVDRYREVANAYLNGLEQRVARQESINDLSSVASFFVSRLDSIVEKSLSELVSGGKLGESEVSRFVGKVGIANSRLAYEIFHACFGDARFASLKRAGARLQRPLWASTGVKNPKLPELLYVEALGGEDTVNTLPPNTLKALLSAESVGANLAAGLEEARRCVADVSAKVPFEKLLSQLELEGVESFAESYRELLKSIKAKASVLSEKKISQCC